MHRVTRRTPRRVSTDAPPGALSDHRVQNRVVLVPVIGRWSNVGCIVSVKRALLLLLLLLHGILALPLSLPPFHLPAPLSTFLGLSLPFHSRIPLTESTLMLLVPITQCVLGRVPF